MTLIINNDDVAQVLTMEITMAALREAYEDLAKGYAVCRPRIDIHIPTSDPEKTYQWGTMEGGSRAGYFAIRMKSDIIYEQEYEGTRTQEKYCSRPGLYCGLILLNEVETGVPLAIMNDGFLQHMRVGADSAIGADYMARKDAKVVGMIGSGGMARTHIAAFRQVRDIERVQVFSPTRENREAYAREIGEKYNIEAVPVDTPEAAFKGADIVAGCTDATGDVIYGEFIEPGTHMTAIGGLLDETAMERVDVALRLGDANTPEGMEGLGIADEKMAYDAKPLDGTPEPRMRTRGERAHGYRIPDRTILLPDLLKDPGRGRTSDDQITFSERGNIQGAQFYAVAGRVYELAKEKGLGHDLPTEWLLQDIRD
jgi:ornithine cyclodeaminase/alanine dehydrogenase-like protein (mu-crystallin family)